MALFYCSLLAAAAAAAAHFAQNGVPFSAACFITCAWAL